MSSNADDGPRWEEAQIIDTDTVRGAYLFFCDYTYRDAAGKMGICGIFDTVVTRAVPVSHGPAYMVTRVDGPVGTTGTLGLRLVDPHDGAVLAGVQGPVTFERDRIDLAAKINSVVFPRFDTYHLEVTFDERPLLRLKVTVKASSAPGAPL